jgi:hypothetical protein
MTPRPSSLPKLLACGQFQSAPGTSDAAARGTMLDGVFRESFLSGVVPKTLSDVDAEAVRWAIGEMYKLPIFELTDTEENLCRIHVPMLGRQGTADAVNVRGRWIADLKSGQVYDYEAQMAAYCLGLMTEHLELEWTAHLLFCDQQRVVTHHFTFRQASEIVLAALDNVGKPPAPCQYCDWCVHALDCKPRVEAATTALTTTDETFATILADPDKLGEFLSHCKVLEKFQSAAEEVAREMLGDGKSVAGWRLGKPRSSQFVDAEDLMQFADKLTPQAIVAAYGSISGKKAEKLFADAGLQVPSGLIKTKTTTAPLTKCN